MAHLTINDLKNELANHGVELPHSSAKKEEYVLLYEKNVVEKKAKNEFSSDDEGVSIPVEGKVSKKKESEGIVGNEDCDDEPHDEVLATEENSLVVGGIDVGTLTDEELEARLKEFNIAVGPLLNSTRAVYRKRLAVMMRGIVNGENSTAENSLSASVHVAANNNMDKKNAIGDTVDGELKDADFSADDEEDPYQPSCTTISLESSLSKENLSDTSSISNSFCTNIRQRFADSNKEARAVDGGYTATPRKSIHSYKITETSKETVTKMKDGTISRVSDYTKTTSNSDGEIEGAGKFLRFLPLFLLVIAAAGYCIYVKVGISDILFAATY